MIIPGVQKPHWRPCFSQNACLERVERAVAGLHPLDRRDGRAVGLDRQHRAALHGLAVDVDGAGAALARVAADVGPGQLEVLAEELDEHPSRLDIPLPWLSVDDERDVLGHDWSLLPGPDRRRRRRLRGRRVAGSWAVSAVRSDGVPRPG